MTLCFCLVQQKTVYNSMLRVVKNMKMIPFTYAIAHWLVSALKSVYQKHTILLTAFKTTEEDYFKIQLQSCQF